MTHRVTKSLLSSVVGTVIDRGMIKSVHDPVVPCDGHSGAGMSINAYYMTRFGYLIDIR